MCAAVDGRGSVGFDLVAEEDGTGESDVMASRASAATIPPIECPIRIVWTEGSTVGEGVAAATSRSMTLFWSLHVHLFSSSDLLENILRRIYHSLKCPTHSFRSPLVSNLG